jgi:hypothetical protein
MDLWETGRGVVEWIHLAQNRDSWQALHECIDETSGAMELVRLNKIQVKNDDHWLYVVYRFSCSLFFL